MICRSAGNCTESCCRRPHTSETQACRKPDVSQSDDACQRSKCTEVSPCHALHPTAFGAAAGGCAACGSALQLECHRQLLLHQLLLAPKTFAQAAPVCDCPCVERRAYKSACVVQVLTML